METYNSYMTVKFLKEDELKKIFSRMPKKRLVEMLIKCNKMIELYDMSRVCQEIISNQNKNIEYDSGNTLQTTTPLDTENFKQ